MLQVVFPEGTRISKKTQKSSKEFMKKQGYPELRHLICPRFKGTQDILREVGLQMLLIGISIRAAFLPDVAELCHTCALPCLQGRDTFKAVYDVTIGYKPIAKYLFWRCASTESFFPKRTMSYIVRYADSRCAGVVSLRVADLFRRLPAEVHVHIDRLPIDSVPVR